MNAVLVLNQDYSPLTTCSVQRAFLLVFLRKAELINDVKERKLRTIVETYPFPSVIKLNRYVAIPYKEVVLSRYNVLKRDQNKCQYCGINRDLTLDHVIPKSKGGKSSWTNLVTACMRCNARKGNNTPEIAGMRLRKPPTKPAYNSIFKSANGYLREEWKPYIDPKRALA